MDIIELKEIVKERGIHATARASFPNKDLALWKVRMTHGQGHADSQTNSPAGLSRTST